MTRKNMWLSDTRQYPGVFETRTTKPGICEIYSLFSLQTFIADYVVNFARFKLLCMQNCRCIAHPDLGIFRLIGALQAQFLYFFKQKYFSLWKCEHNSRFWEKQQPWLASGPWELHVIRNQNGRTEIQWLIETISARSPCWKTRFLSIAWIEKLLKNKLIFVKTRETGPDQFHRFSVNWSVKFKNFKKLK
jgi:hypothetical protein